MTASLKDLPVEVYGRMVPFLSRQGLLAFYQALSTHKEAQGVLERIVCRRLESMCQSWEKCVPEEGDRVGDEEQTRRWSQLRPSVRRAAACIREVIVTGRSEENTTTTTRQRRLEDMLMVTEFFSFPDTTVKSGLVEWPTWSGRIQVLVWVPRGSFHGMQRVLIEANVQLVSPCFDPVHYPAWNVVARDDNSIQLVAEAYNFIPTTPMGRFIGITQADQETLQTLALHLRDQNTVAVPPPGRLSRQRMLQALRIVSRSQAKQRLANMPARLPYRFYVDNAEDGHDTDLICCWELRDLFQDGTGTTAQTLMPYWQTILQTREAGAG